MKLGVLVSGRGSNLQAILDAIAAGTLNAEVAAVVSDKPDAPALRRVEADIAVVVDRKAHLNAVDFEDAIASVLEERGVQLVVLAGFMRVLSPAFVRRFAGRIFNIHPSLLPSFPGLHGQRQALEHGVKVSGCTVHLVDETLDGGPILAQAAVPVFPDDTEESLSRRILKEEHRLLPETIGQFASRALSRPIGSDSPIAAKVSMENLMESLAARIEPLDARSMREAAAYQDKLLKPAGSLGQLEAIAVQIAGITGRLHNRTDRKILFLFGSDHGVYDEGVSASPQDFTRVLMELYAKGEGCGINVLCRQAGVELRLIDLGVKGLSHHSGIDSRFRLMPDGTGNFARGAALAMLPKTAVQAVQAGFGLASEAKEDGFQILGTGEVGMGNTTPAAACIMAALGIDDPSLAVGRGGGLTDEAFQGKKRVVAEALKKHKPDPSDPIDILSKVGGLDIAGMTGVFLGAAYHRLPVVIDGVISVAAALLAAIAAPLSKDFMIPSHLSHEPGYALAMDRLKLTPLLNLGMRLGEGSGCPMAMRVVDDALALMNSMNTFDGASLESEYRKKLKT
ncbi:MAG: nicotinate-nucleotide--dimethylbenzimidazole phosphoribosyltransferase [Synergistaceae bacterium]|jgi:nicotinate-nucleotide--dimethylbenzimidazole phosphoribosyltransferase|nr:nicotinate-nucleotide--dimethylbenzimidazole phosphoribosyltransferase [Synergistaceae bacterium]